MQTLIMFPSLVLAAFNLRAMQLHEDPRHTPQPRGMGQETSSSSDNADIEHYCNAAIHPVTGEHMTNYMKLKKDPATTDVWSRAFGKEFGGLAQGDDLTREKGTNTVVVMTHEEIAKIPREKVVTYARVVPDYRPQKDNARTESESLRAVT